MSQLPIIAAIPNYNMASQLKRLLPQILAQPYDAIYVLDDASTDNSRAVVHSFGEKVQFVAGRTNICSGGNRNRILKVLSAPAIIHFLDADTELVSENTPAIIRSLMHNSQIGIGGGLVTTPTGQPEIWNYGPGFSLYSFLTAGLLHRLETKLPVEWRKPCRRLFRHMLRDWPDIRQTPQYRKTYWVHEANLVIRSDVFAEVGGFDAMVRSHDIQDLAIRIQRSGYQTIFDPRIVVIQHNESNVRIGDRGRARKQAARHIIHKNGVWNVIVPGGHIRPRYNE